jgi:outer membrane protein OmpA-like peptidoglycan-associated protein
MTKAFLIACTALWLPIGAFAQSSVTLDSFSLDLDPEPEPQAAASEMRDCLLDPSSCASDEFGGGAAFSLDDVVNLGVGKRVVQRAPAAGTPTSITSTAPLTQTPPRPPSAPLPTIDLEVLFAYDSDNLTPEAMGKLANLASALRDPRLQGSTLIFIGHTDSVGSAAYNNALSLRRARSVANFVQGTLGLPSSQIEAVGVGFSRLKNSRDPASAQNRRVQLVLVPGA